MHYGKINTHDVANGPGVRVSLFVSGCSLHCKGCFNEETWDFGYGEEFTADSINKILMAMSKDYIEGLTILGGDPFEPENISTVCAICSVVKTAYPEKTIWIYTGRTKEYLIDQINKASIEFLSGGYGNGMNKEIINYGQDIQFILETIDVLVEGPFIEALKDITLRFKGSSNQRILKVTHMGRSNFKFEQIG